jgi:hypothetical protein
LTEELELKTTTRNLQLQLVAAITLEIEQNIGTLNNQIAQKKSELAQKQTEILKIQNPFPTATPAERPNIPLKIEESAITATQNEIASETAKLNNLQGGFPIGKETRIERTKKLIDVLNARLQF